MKQFFQKLLGLQSVEPAAVALADLFVRHVTIAQAGNDRVVKRGFQLVVARATGEKRKQGWRGPALARLANQFGWQLVDRGYPKEFSKDIAKELTVNLMSKSGKPV
jgi:hypothetical protein